MQDIYSISNNRLTYRINGTDLSYDIEVVLLAVIRGDEGPIRAGDAIPVDKERG